MKTELGRKQNETNDHFLKVWNSIGEYVSLEEATRAVDDAAADVLRTTHGKRVGYAWSGGKDSIALQVVMERAGIRKCYMASVSALSFKHYLPWCKEHGPASLEILDYDEVNVGWLARHQQYIFNQRDHSIWSKFCQVRGHDKFSLDNRLDMMILGRRYQDGNYIGPKGSNIIAKTNGVTLYSPIADWPHEMVLAVIHYFKGRELPELYTYPEAFVEGTPIWPDYYKSGEDIITSYGRIYNIDHTLIERAAMYIPTAAQFLNSKRRR